MDWTTNPLVALYFAVRETKTDDDDKPMNSAVYVLISDPPRYTDFTRRQQPAVKPGEGSRHDARERVRPATRSSASRDRADGGEEAADAQRLRRRDADEKDDEPRRSRRCRHPSRSRRT